MRLLQHLFAVMNELLDEIMLHYPNATGERKERMAEQLSALQTMSDTIIDGWLQLEEKLAALRQTDAGNYAEQASAPAAAGQPVTAGAAAAGQAASVPASSAPAKQEAEPDKEELRSMTAGQGYFKLHMFKEAAVHLRQAVRQHPDSVTARLYLAMAHMHLQQWEEAQRHLQLIVKWTSHPKWKALGLNALGCIQAVRANMEQAEFYFRQANEADPSFAGAAHNLTSCKTNPGHLALYFGSAELSCM